MTLDVYDDNRRSGPDMLVKSLTWIAVTGWLLMVAAMFLLDRAKPVTKDFYDKAFDVHMNTRTGWDTEITFYLFIIMLVGLLLSPVGLFINSKRHKRREDTYRISLILLFIVSLFGTVIYLF